MITEQNPHLRHFRFLYPVLAAACFSPAFSREIHVSPRAAGSPEGSSAHPYGSIPAAQQAMRRELAKGGTEALAIVLHEGTHRITVPITLTPADSGTPARPVVWRAAKGASPVVSGGRPITNWRRIEGNHWLADLPDVKSGQWYFRQLWAGDKRLTRARTPNEGFLTTSGPLTPYRSAVSSGIDQKGQVTGGDPKAALLARCGFQFNDGDIQEWDNWREAEIMTYHKWECSWQTVRKIDLAKRLVYMNSPCRYPVGRFGSRMRYRVENVPSALDVAGEWYLDGRGGGLHYMAAAGEDPNTMDIVAPYTPKLLVVEGTEVKTTSHLRFEGIAFKHCRYELGIYDIAPNWPDEIRKHDPAFPENPRPGYTDSQAAPRCGQAVKFTDATDIAFDNCRFNHLGAWALHINWRAHRISLNGCGIFDIGGGAVQIGNPVRSVKDAGIPESWAPSHNRLSNCRIHRAGQVHPSAVGVMIAQAHHNTVEHCEISDLSYSGISNGWTWGREKCHTGDNRIANNYIHRVAQKLGDAAGLYSLGNNPGTIYFENFLDQIVKGHGVHGVVDAMGFDEGSNGIRVERNVVGKISGTAASFNRNSPRDLIWQGNNFSAAPATPSVFPHDPRYDTPALSVAADFLYEGVPGGRDNRRWLVSKTAHELTDGHYGLIIIGKKAGVFLNIGGNQHAGRILLESKHDLQTGSLNHVAFTYDGDTLRIFVNGEASGSLKVGKARSIHNGKLAIGQRSDGALRHGVRNAWIFNRPLSAAEIKGLANHETGKFTREGLTFEWEAKQAAPIKPSEFQAIKARAGLQPDFRELLKGEAGRPIYREGTEWCNIWVPDANKDELPRVLLVGDSITQGYYGQVAKGLAGKAYCARLTTSAAVADPMFETQLRSVVAHYQFDVIHFNNGLHGVDYTEEEYKRGYEKALELIRSKAPQAKVIVSLSTPTKAGGAKDHLIARVEERNKITRDLAKAKGMATDDLFTAMHGHPEYYRDDYHFHGKAVAIQAGVVVKAVRAALK